MTIIGIDPGLDGGICIRHTGVTNSIGVFDIPTLEIGSKRKINAVLLAGILRGADIVAVERVGPMRRPGQKPQGVSSTFSFGETFGLIQGVVAGLGIRLELVTPQKWKKSELSGTQKDKGASRQRAIERYPHLADDLKRKKDHNRADAVLICDWAVMEFC